MKREFSLWDKLLAALLVIVCAEHILWVVLNHAPLAWDSAAHTWISLQILSSLRHGDLHGVLIASNYYPIFVHTITALVMFVVGAHIAVGQYLAILYFILTLLAIYLYTATRFSDKRIAFFSTLTFAFFPIVVDQAHWLMLDVPLTGLVFLSLYFFEKSVVFTKRRPTVYFFVIVSCLLMTKWTGGLFLLFPVLFDFVRSFREKKMQRMKAQMNHILIGIGIVLTICLPWYLTNLHSVANQAHISLQGDGGDPTQLLSLANFTDYLTLFINFQVTPFVAVFVLASIILLLKKRGNNVGYILGSILSGYLLFTIISNKDPRYTLPLLPYAGMLIASAATAVSRYKPVLVRMLGIIFFLITISYTSFLLFRPLSFMRQVTVLVPILGGINVIDMRQELVRTYDPHTWPVSSIIEAVSTNSAQELVVAFEDEHLNPSTLQTFLEANHLQGKSMQVTVKTPDIYYLQNAFGSDAFPDTNSIDSYLGNTTYVLLSSADLGTAYLRNKTALEQLRYRVIEDTLPPCTHYTADVGSAGTVCYIGTDDVLHTGADVRINEQPVTHGSQDIHGYAKVTCPWGCSFGIVQAPVQDRPFRETAVRTYHLPDGKSVTLYRLTHLSP